MSGIIKCDGSAKIKLSDIDAGETGKTSRDRADAKLAKIGDELRELQDLLYAAQDTPLLIVLQGMDTAGKDGTIRSVIGFMNPQGCRVASFKVPTPAEAAHDFLWRVHAETPGKGSIAYLESDRAIATNPANATADRTAAFRAVGRESVARSAPTSSSQARIGIW